MPYIQMVPEDGADSAAAALFDADRADRGYVSNYTAVLAHRPDVLRAWQQLNGAIKASMDLRRYELVTLAAARTLRSSYCMLAHGKVLADRFLREDELRRVALDHRDAELEPVDVAVMDFAEKVVRDAAAITAADVEELRRHGLTDADVLDVALAAAARCFFSKTLDAVGAQPDAEYSALAPELREALTVGRPIAEASA